MVKFIYRRCDVILAHSERFRESILRWGGEEQKIHYVPNWADPFVKNNDTPEWVSRLPDGFKIGFAGNIGKAQDMGTLIAAAELLRGKADIKWIIAGDGSDKAWLDDEIRNRGLASSVFTVGKKPYDDMLPFFKSCDALYVSLTNEYIFSLTVPTKVQAYMSAAKPIVAYLQGEGARIINEAQVGFSVPSGDPAKLAAAIIQMKELSQDQRNKMGLSGLKYFEENFERNLVINKILGILNHTISSNQRA
jgi:glycosyltransferase involved in cell wall biosynthesis